MSALPVKKIASLKDIEQIENDHPLDDLLPFDNTYAAISNTATQCPDRTALSFFLTGQSYQNGVNISYAQLLENITKTANLLNGLGLKENDVVAYILPNLPETHYVIWGGEAACQIMAINPLLEPAQIKSLLNSAKVKALVTMNPMAKLPLWDKVSSILPELDSVEFVLGVDIAHYVNGFKGVIARMIQAKKKRKITMPGKVRFLDFGSAIEGQNGQTLNFTRSFNKTTLSSLFCTGGTTGLPKIAMRSHRNELVNATSALLGAGGMLAEGKTVLCGLPLFHVNATLITGLMPFMQGATVVLATPQGYRGENLFPNFWKIVEFFKVTTFSGVPTLYSTLLQHPVNNADISSLEACLCGAAPMPVEVFKTFQQTTGVKVLEGYGLTEGTCVSTISPVAGEPRIGSIGVRIPYQQMMCAMLSTKGTLMRCDANEVGLVYIRGDNIFLGYKEQHQNDGLWHTDSEGQEWLSTGDMGRQDEDGYFWLTGRQKELIIRGGHNIEPKIIEEAMCAHPDVAMAAAVGSPDTHAGELPVCYVQVNNGSSVTVDTLLDFAKDNIPERAAIPKAIHIIDALPQTAVGKIFKPALQIKEIEHCVNELINEEQPEVVYQLNVAQDKRLGLLATITTDAHPSQTDELKALLGKYAFQHRINRTE